MTLFSDVDIALLLGTSLSSYEQLDLELRIQGEIEAAGDFTSIKRPPISYERAASFIRGLFAFYTGSASGSISYKNSGAKSAPLGQEMVSPPSSMRT